MNFSVDKIRLSISVPVWDMDFLKVKVSNGLLTYYENNKISAYRHNFNLVESVYDTMFNVFTDDVQNTDVRGVNRLWIGISPNCSPSDSDYQKMTIEYNPNKTDLNFGVAQQIFEHYFKSYKPTVDCCDIAIDLFDVPIDNLVYLKNRKNRILDYRQGGGRTVYFGTHASSGFCKVYNKAVEQNLPDKIWTRVEYSFKIDNFLNSIVTGNYIFDCNIPELFFFDFSKIDKFDLDDVCKIKCILDGFCTLDDFSRRTKIKLQGLLSSYGSHYFTCDNVYQKCKDTLTNYIKDLYSYGH